MVDDVVPSEDDKLVPRPRHELARRPDALARRVLGDLVPACRTVLLVCPSRDLRRSVREALEPVPDLLVVAFGGTPNDAPEGVDLILDVEDGRPADRRRSRESRTPRMCVRRTFRGDLWTPGLRSVYDSGRADLVQFLSREFGRGMVPEEEVILRENVAIGLELGSVDERLRARRAAGGKASVLWISRSHECTVDCQELFAYRPYAISGARPEEAAASLRRADPPIDVLVCPVEDAREALGGVAAEMRTRLSWVTEGGDPASDPPRAVLHCMRGALPSSGVRLDQPIDGPTGQFRRLTHLNPLAEHTLYRATRIRDAMEHARTSGLLSGRPEEGR